MGRVFRTEKVNGIGLYHSSGPVIMDCYYDRERHPIYYNDGGLKGFFSCHDDLSTDHFFGYCSMDQLKNWLFLDGWREGCRDAGYVISELECGTMWAGYTQAIFDITDKVECVGRYDLLDFSPIQGPFLVPDYEQCKRTYQ